MVKIRVFASSKEKSIYEIMDKKLTTKFEIGSEISQMIMMIGKKTNTFFAGV